MKIRTITTGITLQSLNNLKKINTAAKFNQNAKNFFEQAGYEVQTTRIATNSWEEYTADLTKQKILGGIKEIENICQNKSVNFFNIGYAADSQNINFIPKIIQSSSLISASAKIGGGQEGIIYENVHSSAKTIVSIAQKTEQGYGNFRFCAAVNCPPGIPFFPAAYHTGETTAFSIGLECGDLAMQAFKKADRLADAKSNLQSIFEKKLGEVTNIAQKISREQKIKFLGIDASLAPGLNKGASVAYAFEQLLPDKFGDQGTLAIASLITDVLHNLSIKTCGYSGLMLPVCEDLGLAKRANQRTYNITNLLLYSAVCGCGLDTVPVPGNIKYKQIESILMDTAALSNKLEKPLSVRLFPVPGRQAGEMTDFQSPFLTDCKILEVK